MATTGNPSRDRTIRSLEDARRKVGVILAEINADPKLAIAAAANPLLALEDLGYEIDPAARVEIGDHVRFGATKAARLKRLRAAIYKTVGRELDLEADDKLREALQQLKVLPTETDSPRRASKQKGEPSAATNLVLLPQLKWGPKAEDPLEPLREKHPVIKMLLEYRQIEASEPRLAARALYDEIRHGQRRTPAVSVRAVLKKTRRGKSQRG